MDDIFVLKAYQIYLCLTFDTASPLLCISIGAYALWVMYMALINTHFS